MHFLNFLFYYYYLLYNYFDASFTVEHPFQKHCYIIMITFEHFYVTFIFVQIPVPIVEVFWVCSNNILVFSPSIIILNSRPLNFCKAYISKMTFKLIDKIFIYCIQINIVMSTVFIFSNTSISFYYSKIYAKLSEGSRFSFSPFLITLLSLYCLRTIFLFFQMISYCLMM